VPKAVVLTSGGLDSILSLTILARQGLEVTGLHCYSWFTVPKYRDFHRLPDWGEFRGFPVRNLNVDPEHTRVLLHPAHGYGSAVNPCLDCKVLFFRKAAGLMREIGADFVASGEVLGQRPMTQRMHALRLTERESGLEGRLLRPLSARLLPPTVPEREGMVNREMLYDIQGRGRRRQMELAGRLGIRDYPSPAGGCLVTEKNFQKRFVDLVRHEQDPGMIDLILLKYGRHFRLPGGGKLIVGKHREENEYLRSVPAPEKASIDVVHPMGPFSLLDWDGSLGALRLSLRIIARYCIHKSPDGVVRYRLGCGPRMTRLSCSAPAGSETIDSLIIR
jgi:hypothetical protein